MNKIKYVSLFFRVLFQIAFLCIIIAQITGWVYVTPASRGYFSVIPTVYQGHLFTPITENTKIAGFLVSSVPVIFELLVLYYLVRLFRLYAKMEFFDMQNVRYIRSTGYALLAAEVLKPVSDFILGFILTSSNPPGLHFATIELTEKNFEAILTALIIILVSWIMAEGCRLQAEQQLTI